ncbi:hypothetical protein [Arthrobacter agilis]|jgi:hypothetical protein|uniref:hypothetical protein n=1 Tax=Arthrobacter agilis TaxID=37921 RepID=UPI002787C3C8|nr:hypothetical protein [Arthrobacter agilis]MDQ0733564.1 hypothetical protein [Arthrobacter agilis]
MSENPGTNDSSHDKASADKTSDDYPETVRAHPEEPAEGADSEEKYSDGSQ